MKEVLKEKIKALQLEGQQIIAQKEKIIVVLNNFNRRITEIEGSINTLNGMLKQEGEPKPVENEVSEDKDNKEVKGKE